MTFLYIALGIILGLVFAFVVIVFWLKRKLNKFAEALKAAIGDAVYVPPFRIHPVRESEPQWQAAEQVNSAAGTFRELGYQDVGTYTIDDQLGTTLMGFFHPPVGSFAVVYDIPGAGAFLDVVVQLTDGSHITVSTTPPDGMDRPPFVVMQRLQFDDPVGPAAVQQAHARLVELIDDRDVVTRTADEFEICFRRAYAQEMDWRMDRGGPTDEEIRRVAALNGGEQPTDEQIERIQSTWRNSMAWFVQDQLREAYLNQATMTGMQLDELQERLFVVHEKSTPQQLEGELMDRLPYDEDDEDDGQDEQLRQRFLHQLNAGSPREGFRRALSLHPAGPQYRRIAVASKPWPADLYVAPGLD